MTGRKLLVIGYLSNDARQILRIKTCTYTDSVSYTHLVADGYYLPWQVAWESAQHVHLLERNVVTGQMCIRDSICIPYSKCV